MNNDYELSRNSMVENQLKPNNITDKTILNLFLKIKKENFLSLNNKFLAYTDLDIEIVEDRGYLKNLHIAQMLQSSEIKKDYNILHIGGLTGYVSTLLSFISKKVTVIENDENLINSFKENIELHKLDNIFLKKNNFEDGCLNNSPYDLIIIDNPINKISSNILNQLNNNFGKLVMIENISTNLCKAIKITRNQNEYSKEVLFDIFSKFKLLKPIEEFVF